MTVLALVGCNGQITGDLGGGSRVPLEYTGSSAGATARVAATQADPAAGTSIVLTHFSGGLEAWATENGKLDADAGKRSMAEYQRQWWEAERDRLRNDPALKQKLDGGDPADVDGVLRETAEMIVASREIDKAGGGTVQPSISTRWTSNSRPNRLSLALG